MGPGVGDARTGTPAVAGAEVLVTAWAVDEVLVVEGPVRI